MFTGWTPVGMLVLVWWGVVVVVVDVEEGIAVERGHVLGGPFTMSKGPPQPGL